MSAAVAAWRDDVLPGYQALDLPLPKARPAPGEPTEALLATLVRRQAGRTGEHAVLYVHGWNDYFFQTHLADALTGLGFAFYALDLRRYGRSLRAGQLRGWVDDLDDYAEELDLALALVAAEHPRVTVVAHSTGGLITALWAARRPGQLAGLVLNAPWLDLQGSAMLRALGPPILAGLAQRLPTAVLPVPDSGLYARTLLAASGGEWTYDVGWKSTPSWPVRAGWLSAVLRGHQRVAAGLGVDVPVLVMCSARSDFRRIWHEDLRRADVVLDVELIAQRAVRLGPQVTVLRIEGAVHDLVLSADPVRRQVIDQLSRWARAYLLDAPGPGG